MARIRCFTSGHTSLKCGFLALGLTPAVVMVPLTVILLVAFNIRVEGRCHIMSFQGQMLELGTMALVLYGATVLLGVPTWMLLRLVKGEGALTYLSMGMAEGLLCAFYLVYSKTGTLSLNQAMGFCVLALTGGIVGSVFWRIARDPARDLQSGNKSS